METGPDAGSEIEIHSILICESGQHRIIQLDNADRAATIRPLKLLAVRSGATAIPLLPRAKQPQDFGEHVHRGTGASHDRGF